MQIDPVDTTGSNPGWISRHSAEQNAARNAVKVTGGQLFTAKRGERCLGDNRRSYWL